MTNETKSGPQKINDAISAAFNGDTDLLFDLARKMIGEAARLLRDGQADAGLVADAKLLDETLQKVFAKGTKRTVDDARLYAEFVREATGVTALDHAAAIRCLELAIGIDAVDQTGEGRSVAQKLWPLLSKFVTEATLGQSGPSFPDVPGLGSYGRRKP